jgi:hypothetical protein
MCPQTKVLGAHGSKVINSPWKKKGNGRGVHVSDWICETTGQLALSPEQVKAQLLLPEHSRLRVTDARKIIYPGKTMTLGGISISFVIRQRTRLIFSNTCIRTKWVYGFLIVPQPTKVWQLMH